MNREYKMWPCICKKHSIEVMQCTEQALEVNFATVQIFSPLRGGGAGNVSCLLMHVNGLVCFPILCCNVIITLSIYSRELKL